MKRNLVVTFICFLFALHAFAEKTAGLVADTLKVNVNNALLRSEKTPEREVSVLVRHGGNARTAVLSLGTQQKKVTLQPGENKLFFRLPEVKEPTVYPLMLAVKGAEPQTEQVTLHPVDRKWQVNFVQHSHTDIGYTRAQHEILAEHIRFIDYALDYCDLTDSYPDDARFRWTCETAWAVSEYIRTRPAKQVERLKKRIAEGRIEVTAMYFNFDELPDEQSLAQSLYPFKQFKEEGIPVESAMQNDVNGIGWCFSEFFPELGVKYLTMGTHGHKALICFDKPTVFWWESPSGKRTLAYRAEHYNQGNFLQVEKNNFDLFEQRMFTYINEMQAAKYPFDILSIQFSGYFTDNAPPSTAGSDMVKQWNEKYAFPRLRQATSSEFMRVVEKDYGKDLQVIRGAWPDWWTDGFGSAAREAAITRRAHTDIISNQVALSLAKLLGSEIPESLPAEILDANKALLFYGEHTFGYSESVRDPFDLHTMEQKSHKAAYAWESYRRTRPIGETALGMLQAYVPRLKDHATIAVFNPMNWKHSGVTIVYVDHQQMPLDKKITVKDEQGNPIRIQPVSSRTDATYWALWAEDIPAFGMRNYTIWIDNAPAAKPTTVVSAPDKIENEWYTIRLDASKGVVTEWFDKQLNCNLLSNNATWKMGELIYERDDVRGALDQKRPGNFVRKAPDEIRFNGYQSGAIWDTYRFVGTSPAGMGKDNFTFELRVYNVTKQVNFVYKLNKKQETGPEAVYVSFPFELPDGKIFFDVPGGVMEAGVDQIPGSSNDWNTVQNFAAVRNGKQQIVLGSQEIPLMQFGNINLGRFKAGATPETNHIFTWPMNNYWVTNFNAEQQGEFEWSYFLTSSADNSIKEATQFAWGNRIPLQARVISAGTAVADKVVDQPILSISADNLLVVNMAPVAGENALLLQLREVNGTKTPLQISSPFRPNLKAVVCNPIGIPYPETQALTFNPFETKFVKVSW